MLLYFICNHRGYLLKNPSQINEYSQLKKELSEKYPNDINSYVDGKTNFILHILQIQGVNKNDLNVIKEINNLPSKKN